MDSVQRLAHCRAGGDGAALAKHLEGDQALHRRRVRRASGREKRRCPLHRNETRDPRRSLRAPPTTDRRWPFPTLLRPAQFLVAAYAPGYQNKIPCRRQPLRAWLVPSAMQRLAVGVDYVSTCPGEFMARTLLVGATWSEYLESC